MTCRIIYIVKGSFFPFILCLAMLLNGCSRSQAELALEINIRSPQDGTFLMRDEPLLVSVDIHAPGGFEHMELYHDQILLAETTRETFDTLLRVPEDGMDSHQVLVRASSKNLETRELVSSYHVVESAEEANDLESFSDAAPLGWFLNNWELTKREGKPEDGSLLSTGPQAVAIARKRLSEAGCVSFQVKNGSDILEFYVDGLLKARWFGLGDWAEYFYTLDAGEHTCRWIANGSQASIDEVRFEPGITKHSPGEYFGGGIVFYVDSSLEHGLIAAFEDGTYDGHREIPWGCNGLQLRSGNRATSKSNGAQNTLAIVRDCDWEQTAARYCHNLEVKEGLIMFDDWYLPALDELALLYKHREIVGNLDGEYYWSSTTQTTYGARVINFYDGSHHGANRNIPKVAGPVSAGIFVRPVRKF